MNTVYESTLEEPVLNRIACTDEGYPVYPVGTFAGTIYGTIYKVLYRSNGHFVASDTSDQLIFDGLR
jgi:hypothetical protein